MFMRQDPGPLLRQPAAAGCQFRHFRFNLSAPHRVVGAHARQVAHYQPGNNSPFRPGRHLPHAGHLLFGFGFQELFCHSRLLFFFFFIFASSRYAAGFRSNSALSPPPPPLPPAINSAFSRFIIYFNFRFIPGVGRPAWQAPGRRFHLINSAAIRTFRNIIRVRDTTPLPAAPPPLPASHRHRRASGPFPAGVRARHYRFARPLLRRRLICAQ